MIRHTPPVSPLTWRSPHPIFGNGCVRCGRRDVRAYAVGECAPCAFANRDKRHNQPA
jgi:hypothetical protein